MRIILYENYIMLKKLIELLIFVFIFLYLNLYNTFAGYLWTNKIQQKIIPQKGNDETHHIILMLPACLLIAIAYSPTKTSISA